MEGPKSPEKLIVSSGSVLCIDQFMLGNEQCLAAVRDAGPREGVARYGGVIFDFPQGEYCVFRDPQLQVLAIGLERAAECSDEEGLGTVIESFGPTADSAGKVAVDTRCVAISDASILDNTEVLNEFGRLRREGKEKEARDLLRQNGAAVRYGFNKFGDELSLFTRTTGSSPLAALWPEG